MEGAPDTEAHGEQEREGRESSQAASVTPGPMLSSSAWEDPNQNISKAAYIQVPDWPLPPPPPPLPAVGQTLHTS